MAPVKTHCFQITGSKTIEIVIKRLILSLIFVAGWANFCLGIETLSLDENKPITEGEFTALLIQAIGYEQELPADAKAGDYIILLERYGIAPVGAWQPDLPLTYGRMATILSRAMNLEHESVNDTDKCFNNVCEINKGWYMKYKETNIWPQLNDLEKPVCPFGLAYEDTTGNHLVARHSHPDVAEVEKAYFEALKERDMMLGERSPSDLLSRGEARRIIESNLSSLLLAKGYLTPPTPILPKEAALKSAGRLVFIVYEDGLVDDRKVEWPVLWSKDKIVSVAIVYSHDATLNNNKSIKMYIDGIEVDSCQGTWTRLTPDEHIWIGSQSQSGLFPSGIYIYDLKIYDLIKTDFVSEETAKAASEGSILFWSLLDSKDQILSPKKGSPGDISKKIYAETDISKVFLPGEGFLSNFDGEYVSFPTPGNINILKGTIEFQAKPTFTSSKTEHVLINNVKWDAKNGASGFYLYYQPEQKS